MDETENETNPKPEGTPSSGGTGEAKAPKAEKPAKKKKDKKEKKISGRGVETLFRNVYRIHSDLCSLADQKANLLMTINGLVMAVVIGTNGFALSSDPVLLVPTIVVLLSALFSMVFAVLAARPRLETTAMDLEGARKEPGNLLFFGNFVALNADDFTEVMMDLVSDNEKVYPAMSRNIYGLGKVLQKKYDRLRYAYMVILIGLPIGVSSFIAIHLWRALASS